MRADILNNWGYRTGFLSWFLYPFSLFYAGAVSVRRFLYGAGFLKKERLGCYTISVGNLTLGGTGKTPFVIALALFLKGKGLKVAVLSRGYGRAAKEPVLIPGAGSGLDVSVTGDEPLLIAERADVPVAVCADRLKGFSLLPEKPDVVILDDAFQHIRLERDLEICLVDGSRCFGNGLVFPAGPLREPLRFLKEADLVVLTKKKNWRCFENVGGFLNRSSVFFFCPDIECVKAGKPSSFPAEAFVVTCIPGYGFFVSQLKKKGVRVTGLKIFPDHHRYRLSDVLHFFDKPVIVTEKDWINLPPELRDRVFVARQILTLDPDLADFIEEKLRC